MTDLALINSALQLSGIIATVELSGINRYMVEMHHTTSAASYNGFVRRVENKLNVARDGRFLYITPR